MWPKTYEEADLSWNRGQISTQHAQTTLDLNFSKFFGSNFEVCSLLQEGTTAELRVHISGQFDWFQGGWVVYLHIGCK